MWDVISSLNWKLLEMALLEWLRKSILQACNIILEGFIALEDTSILLRLRNCYKCCVKEQSET